MSRLWRVSVGVKPTDFDEGRVVDDEIEMTDEERRSVSLTSRLHRRGVVNGSIVLPAAPAMVADYVKVCDDTFRAIGVEFSEDQLHHLQGILVEQLAIAYAASPRSEIVITYDKPVGSQINYFVKAQWASIDAAYGQWVATREPPYFGTEPDAFAVSYTADVEDPSSFPILDVGAGTGRNALAFARRGFPVDAVELSPKFVDILRREVKREKLDVRVVAIDVFAASDELRRDYQLLLVSEVVSDFRSMHQLREVFALASRCLAPGGLLMFNTFVAKDDYLPDDAALQLAQQCYSAIFTRSDLAAASAGLPLVSEREEPVFAYEQANLPAEAWPPTKWYEAWVRGQDVFDLEPEESPIEFRWFAYRRST